METITRLKEELRVASKETAELKKEADECSGAPKKLEEVTKRISDMKQEITTLETQCTELQKKITQQEDVKARLVTAEAAQVKVSTEYDTELKKLETEMKETME